LGTVAGIVVDHVFLANMGLDRMNPDSPANARLFRIAQFLQSKENAKQMPEWSSHDFPCKKDIYNYKNQYIT